MTLTATDGAGNRPTALEEHLTAVNLDLILRTLATVRDLLVDAEEDTAAELVADLIYVTRQEG